MSWSMLAACVIALAPSTGVAQIALSDQPELGRLVDLCAQRLGIRVSYEDQALKSKVTLRQDQPLTDDELWKLTNRLLAEQGMTTVRAGDDDTIAVVKLASAPQVARVEALDQLRAEKQLAASGGHLPVTVGFRRVLVPLQRASTKDVIAAAQLVLSKSSTIVGGAAPGGLAGVENDQTGLLVIADLTPFLESALTLIQQLDGPDGNAGAIVREVRAQHVDTIRLAALVKQVADKRKAVGGRELRGELIPTANGSTLLLVAPQASIAAWESVIASVDQREPIERRTYQPSSFGLKEVANLIDQTVRGGSGTLGAAAAASTTDDRWKVVQDELTGSLIITATPTQHEQITELIQRLANVPAESRRPVRSFKIRNRGVKEVQQVIEDLLRAGVLEAQAVNESASNGSSGANGFNGSIASAGSQTTPRSFEPGGTSSPSGVNPPISGSTAPSNPPPVPNSVGRGVGGRGRDSGSVGGNAALTLTSDEATNTLIAVGEPRLLTQLENLLPTLDVRQPQVMLEAILVSMSDSQSVNFGLELEHLRVSGDTMIRLSSLFGLSTAAAGAAGRTRAVGDGAGFTGSVLNPGDFSVVVRALETLNKGRSLSTPKLLVNNNQQATFNSVLQQPFATTNASTTVATTAFGGTQDAGTTISVKPQIAEGDHLVLTYSVSLSSFVGAASSANVPPPRQQNSVQSVATIPDGYTVVIGGIELNTDGNDTTQIPIIGDIPLVGELFKNRSKNQGRQRFYVFLRASVLRQSNLEDLKYLSDVDTKAAGVSDGWPTVRPRVIR